MTLLSKKGVILGILLLVSLATVIGTLTPYLLSYSTPTTPASFPPGAYSNPPQPPQIILPPKEEIKYENRFQATLIDEDYSIWYIKDFPFTIYQSMVLTNNVAVFNRGVNTYRILKSSNTTLIHLLNNDIMYILIL